MKRQFVLVQAWLNGLDLFVAIYPFDKWEKWSHEIDYYLDANLHVVYFGPFQVAWWQVN